MSDEQTENSTAAMSVDPQAEEEAQTPTNSSPSNGTSLGGRVRKTTQKFTFVETKSDETEDFTPPVGKGTKVRDIPFVNSSVEMLGKKQEEMIRQLYSVMFSRRYQQKNMKVIKEQLLEFSGIPEQDKKSREHLVAKIGKWKVAFVQEVMDLLAVDRSKKSFEDEGKSHDKESLVERLIDWLYDPKKTKVAEKKLAAAERAEKAKARKKARVAKEKENKAKKAGTSKPAKKKRKTAKKAVAAEDDDDEEDEEEEEEETESEGNESSSDFDEPKKTSKKRRNVTRRPKKAIVESEGEDDKEDGSAAGSEKGAEAAKDTEPKDESKAALQEDVKTDALAVDVCDKVRDIIANGNAEELTVKKIVRQLSADLGRDMSTQKKAIKEFITSDQMQQ
ncbi:hypothetical protein JM18_006845 [Phytophthora kernoviae]|uniref:DEK-C domain-containing protein n=2 Tax=Phytophthora kernoviae TaxID=325452 RepID=A0A921SDD8_9STRA|nr:hypothetical protein G195_008285 [Phytophthora kernoviae 00238/432]KAG2520690.1 hypothetical protein JM18_006845 [Phytophthora kernoviae]